MLKYRLIINQTQPNYLETAQIIILQAFLRGTVLTVNWYSSMINFVLISFPGWYHQVSGAFAWVSAADWRTSLFSKWFKSIVTNKRVPCHLLPWPSTLISSYSSQNPLCPLATLLVNLYSVPLAQFTVTRSTPTSHKGLLKLKGWGVWGGRWLNSSHKLLSEEKSHLKMSLGPGVGGSRL